MSLEAEAGKERYNEWLSTKPNTIKKNFSKKNLADVAVLINGRRGWKGNAGDLHALTNAALSRSLEVYLYTSY